MQLVSRQCLIECGEVSTRVRRSESSVTGHANFLAPETRYLIQNSNLERKNMLRTINLVFKYRPLIVLLVFLIYYSKDGQEI